MAQESWHKTQKVFALAQTADGFLWAGTDGGLLRHDGRAFRVFTSDVTKGMRSNIVRALTLDREGNLWLGLGDGEGLCKMRPGAVFEPLDTGLALTGRNVTALASGHDDSVWIGTDGGLFHYDARHPKTATRVVSPDEKLIHAVHVDRSGRIWFGSDAGLFEVREGRAQAVPGVGPVLALTSTTDGQLWVSDANVGVVTLGPQGLQTALSMSGLGSQPSGITALTVDSDGAIWVGWNWGYGRLDGGSLSPLQTTSLPTVSLLADVEGGIWVGTFWGVVFRSAVPRVTTEVYAGPHEKPIIFGLASDNDGALWLSQVSSLVKVTPTANRRFESGRTLPSYCPRGVARAFQGGVWLATCDEGLLHVSDAGVDHITADASPRLRNIETVFEDANRDVWLGTVAGELYRMRGRVIEKIPITNGDCDPAVKAPGGTPYINDECAFSITAIEPARAGGIWLAVRRNGLRRVSQQGEEVYFKKDGLPTNQIIALHEDDSGSLWIGTQGHGLVRFRSGRFDTFGRSEGLLAQSVHGITADAQGNLWISSESGISSILHASVAEFLADRSRKLVSRGYGVSDGLASPITVQGFSSPILALGGDILVPLDKGLAIIDTQRVGSTKGFANAVLESVRVNGAERINETLVKVDLPANPNRLASLEFDFVVPNFEVPQRVDVLFRLYPLELSWRSTEGERTVRYHDIPAGTYTFEIRPALDQSPWGEVTRSPTLVLSSFYRRPLFFWLLASMAIPFAALYYIFRLRMQRARFNSVLDERNRIARDLHDTLAQYFTGMSFQMARLSMTLNEDVKAADDINEVTKMMLAQCRLEARQAIHNLRSMAYSPKGVVATLKMLADDTRLSADVNVEFTTNGQECALDEERLSQLVRITQEATVNAVTHAQASCISIDVKFDAGKLVVTIQDDGEGFDVDRVHEDKPMHFGLQGIRERANDIGADIFLQSSEGGGTVLRLTLTLNARG